MSSKNNTSNLLQIFVVTKHFPPTEFKHFPLPSTCSYKLDVSCVNLMIHKSFLASHIIVLNLVRGFLFFVCLLSHDCLLNICILCFPFFYSIRKIDDEECSWKRRPTIAISFNIFFTALFIYHVIALPRSCFHGSRQTTPAMT